MNRKQRVFLIGLIAVGILSSCDQKAKQPATTPVSTEKSVERPAGSQIAYVDIDSLEANFAFWAEKKESFERRQRSMENEIERMSRNFQNEAAAFQKKAQAGTLSQSEGEAAQRKLSQMQMDIESKGQSMSTQMRKEQEEFTKELQQRLDDFLETYNQDGKYAYILSYSKGAGMILFADKALDITADVVKGLNEAYAQKDAGSKAEKK